MGNTFWNRDYQQQAPPSSMPTSVSTSQTHEHDGSTQSHTYLSKMVTVSENKESLTILAYQNHLINAISANTLSIAVALQEHELISDEVSGKILRPSSTPQEKAAILVNAVREKIQNDPKLFPGLIRVFSEQVLTKDIAKMLQSAYQDISSSEINGHLSQPRQIRNTAVAVHSHDDDTPSQQDIYKPLKITQSASDSMIVSSTESKTQSYSKSPHHQQQHATTSIKDESVQIAPYSISEVPDANTSASVILSSESAYKAMIHCRDKLVTALSTDIVNISGILVANEFVPAEVSSKMLLTTLTPQEKATYLVIVITEQIKLAPDRFQELIKIFSEQTCTKVIVTQLSSHVKCKQIVEDRNKENKDDVGVTVSTNQKYAVCEGHMYTAWASLDPDDKIDLEARLLTEAEKIGEKFAHLCSMARDSFEERGITPQVLADTLMDLTVYKPGSSCHDIIPLLKEEGGALIKAQSVRDTFHALRPHMSFFNYEILKYLIERKGSGDDKIALAMFLEKFTEFCKRHVFEVPLTTYSNGHQVESHNKKQKLHIKVTEHFKAAFLIKSRTEALPSTGSSSQAKNICSSGLGINLEDAKNIQRKFASILDLNPSSLFLDSISEGSVILTFLLPMCVSLAGLDHDPQIALLSSSGIIILCGPPGIPQLQELTPNGMIVNWSPPEYGCNSLAQYILYYQKKCEYEVSEWQKVELTSLETHACVHNLDDGEAYVVKICTVSDTGTLQYSDESDPIVWSVMRYFTKDAINRCSEMLILVLSSNNSIIKQVTTSSLTEGIISKVKQIDLAVTPSEKAIILVDDLRVKMQLVPEIFEKLVQILSNHSPMYTMNIVDTLRSDNVHFR